MNRMEYLSEFASVIDKEHPDKENRTVKDYLDTFASVPPTLEKVAKCATAAEVHRDKGNILHLLRKYKEAAIVYTDCLRKAPPYSKCAAMAYANRSQVLYHLEEYEECILDANRAQDLPCPGDIRRDLNLLKADALGNLNKAQKQTKSNTEEIDDLKYAHGENSELPGVSRGIEVQHNPQDLKDGRKLIAKMPFKAGDVLVVQNPYMPVMDFEEDPTYCYHCLKKTYCLIPCDQCCYEVYCSEKCRTQAYENYHRTECEIQSTLITAFPLNREGLVCQLRCLIILTEQGTALKSVYDDLKEIEDHSDPAKLGVVEQNFYGNPRKAFLSLLSDKKVKQVLEEEKCYSGATFEATYIVTLLRNHTNFFKKNSDIPTVAKLLLKMGTTHATKHFTIPYFRRPDIKARVIYPTISLANHACVNNTVAYIDSDNRIVLRALQNIRPGDEILCGYRIYFDIEETTFRSGRILQCKRLCKQCDKIYSYPPEKPQHVKMDQKLRNTLQKNPYNVKALWKLFNILHGKHQRYSLQALMVKSMLVDAYEGDCDHVAGITQFRTLGIL